MIAEIAHSEVLEELRARADLEPLAEIVAELGVTNRASARLKPP